MKRKRRAKRSTTIKVRSLYIVCACVRQTCGEMMICAPLLLLILCAVHLDSNWKGEVWGIRPMYTRCMHASCIRLYDESSSLYLESAFDASTGPVAVLTQRRWRWGARVNSSRLSCGIFTQDTHGALCDHHGKFFANWCIRYTHASSVV